MEYRYLYEGEYVLPEDEVKINGLWESCKDLLPKLTQVSYLAECERRFRRPLSPTIRWICLDPQDVLRAGDQQRSYDLSDWHPVYESQIGKPASQQPDSYFRRPILTDDDYIYLRDTDVVKKGDQFWHYTSGWLFSERIGIPAMDAYTYRRKVTKPKATVSSPSLCKSCGRPIQANQAWCVCGNRTPVNCSMTNRDNLQKLVKKLSQLLNDLSADIGEISWNITKQNTGMVMNITTKFVERGFPSHKTFADNR